MERFGCFSAIPALGSKEAYVPGLTKEFVSQAYGIPLDDVAKLGSAENPFGPSPKAAEAVKAAMSSTTIPIGPPARCARRSPPSTATPPTR